MGRRPSVYKILGTLAVFAAQGLIVSAAIAQDDADPTTLWSIIAPLAPQSLVLDGARIANKLVVVGERGHILISDDGGQNWQQVSVPTRATLTGVYFHDAERGWAVGHDAVILRTGDGGQNWERVHFAPDEERPLLDIWFEDDQHGIATGAYGYFLETFDGGASWEDRFFEALDPDAEDEEQDAAEDMEITSAVEMMEFLDDEDPVSDLHLNDIRAAADGTLYIAAEAGHIFRSDDSGNTWRMMPSPYEGSFYGTLPLGDGQLLLFGLRDNLFFSADRGESWADVDAGTDAILMGGTQLADGSAVVAGLGGTLLVASPISESAAPEFTLVQQEDRKAIATVIQNAAGDLILIGEDGVKKLLESEYLVGTAGN